MTKIKHCTFLNFNKKQLNQFCIISTLDSIGNLYSTDCYESLS